MEKEIIERWERGKENLRNYLSTHSIWDNCSSYNELVYVLIKECLNYSIDEVFSTKFTCIDDGDYQGTQLFILHYDTYQPNANDYYIFDNEYGSCSGCDTLLGIIGYEYDVIPDENMVNQLMTLCLHMVQRMKRISNLYE
jgi:hypothetical protein